MRRVRRVLLGIALTAVIPGAALVAPSAAQAAGNGHWGGYVHVGPSTGVRSSWSVPAVTCNSTQDRFSQWVGLDGFGSSTVEQIGTRVTCQDGAPHYSAFSQMFPAGPIFYEAANTPVYPGDVMDAQVTYRNGVYFRQVVNTTQGWTITANAGGGARQNASAEIVVEAPAPHYYADFGQADFFAAYVNGQPLSSVPSQQTFAGNGNGIQAAPGALNNSSFSVFYYQET